jgi:hypothetical protein
VSRRGNTSILDGNTGYESNNCRLRMAPLRSRVAITPNRANRSFLGSARTANRTSSFSTPFGSFARGVGSLVCRSRALPFCRLEMREPSPGREAVYRSLAMYRYEPAVGRLRGRDDFEILKMDLADRCLAIPIPESLAPRTRLNNNLTSAGCGLEDLSAPTRGEIVRSRPS